MQLSGCEEYRVRDLRHDSGTATAHFRRLGTGDVAAVTPPEDRRADGSGGRMGGMDVEWGPENSWGSGPRLDEFLLARIAEDLRLAAAAPAAPGSAGPDGHASPFDPARVQAECTAKRRIVLACRELRPDTRILGARPEGMADFPLAPHDQHQLAAVTLALLALPYAGHHEYRPEWRP
jgi:hypothetical protein